MIFETKYTKEELRAEMKRVFIARAKGEEVSVDKLEELLMDAFDCLMPESQPTVC